MIQYSLRCESDHRFDSWFQSADAFEKLQKSRLISCAVCGSISVEKAIMAPRVNHATSKAERPLSAAKSPAEQAMAEFRKHIEANSDYVGSDFVREARAIHDGDAPDRPIWGEARDDEAKKLIEDGVPVAPLPFLPTRKTN
ncbi:hypothetical protein P775_21995 [Puniceibacterium antarcticum]|uniref:Uncharacterized protein n=1 Tax=Puniceibacterium antarcticum TaxID=1206336 RepID=A0A2G8R977_9RHOB|nr:DUF1178 family protein [Puniceibacterium antarcticum]PIL18097.1 hypothetical protein P775_21995 [Puniceibacterium antarcticum]